MIAIALPVNFELRTRVSTLKAHYITPTYNILIMYGYVKRKKAATSTRETQTFT